MGSVRNRRRPTSVLGLLQRIPSLEIGLNSIEIQLKTSRNNTQIATAIYHTIYTNAETCPIRIGKAKANSYCNKAKPFDNKADTFTPIPRRTKFQLLLRIGGDCRGRANRIFRMSRGVRTRRIVVRLTNRSDNRCFGWLRELSLFPLVHQRKIIGSLGFRRPTFSEMDGGNYPVNPRSGYGIQSGATNQLQPDGPRFCSDCPTL